MMTSAPSSEKSDEHQWPMIIIEVQSSTRMLFRASGFLKFSLCRRLASSHSAYSFAASLSPL